MKKIGVQSKNVVYDHNPIEGFSMLKEVGMLCTDFSLNAYLTNTSLYQNKRNDFFTQSISELEAFFRPHKEAAKEMGIMINQMHMPYPIYVPNGSKTDEYLWNQVAPKSMQICHFLDCPYIVMHGLKLAHILGTEEAEWKRLSVLLIHIAP